jgi:hypothetical protein
LPRFSVVSPQWKASGPQAEHVKQIFQRSLSVTLRTSLWVFGAIDIRMLAGASE